MCRGLPKVVAKKLRLWANTKAIFSKAFTKGMGLTKQTLATHIVAAGNMAYGLGLVKNPTPMAPNMKGIGKTIKNTDLASNVMRMALAIEARGSRVHGTVTGCSKILEV